MNFDNIHKKLTSEEILDRYLWTFNSSPTHEMFTKLGGVVPDDFKVNGTPRYFNYISSLGYDKPYNRIYRVYDTLRDNRLVYIGSTSNIEYQFDASIHMVRHAVRGSLLKSQYKLEAINIQDECMNIFRKDLFDMEIYNY